MNARELWTSAIQALSRRKQGFESPRERQPVFHHVDFPFFFRTIPKPSEAVWVTLFPRCPSSRIEDATSRSFAGTVQQLAVHTVGGVVTAAQQLMAIVPADSRLEVEAMVSNRDIGFVHAGQSAAVKIDTFNFTRYGLLHGTVNSVSQDAIVRDKPVDKSSALSPGALSKSSEPQGQELLYAARVLLDKTQMQIDGKLINLDPGMAVAIEIKTGLRRVIEYLLSPLLRYSEESLRER